MYIYCAVFLRFSIGKPRGLCYKTQISKFTKSQEFYEYLLLLSILVQSYFDLRVDHSSSELPVYLQVFQ